MKKIIFLIAFFSAISMGISANTEIRRDVATTPLNEKLSDNEINRIVNRVNEIRNMDLKKLSAKEKSELRKELKEMKSMMPISGGVYIGGTALIIILIVLILLMA